MDRVKVLGMLKMVVVVLKLILNKLILYQIYNDQIVTDQLHTCSPIHYYKELVNFLDSQSLDSLQIQIRNLFRFRNVKNDATSPIQSDATEKFGNWREEKENKGNIK